MMICGIVVMIAAGIGYLFWCSYHPYIKIEVREGPTGKEGIRMEAPHIAMSQKGLLHIAASIELHVTMIVMQHEAMCSYVKDNYQTADIKLDMKEEENQTILTYYGTATTFDNETIDFHREIKLDFVLHADIVEA